MLGCFVHLASFHPLKWVIEIESNHFSQIVQVEDIVWIEEGAGNMGAIIPVTAPLGGKEKTAKKLVRSINQF